MKLTPDNKRDNQDPIARWIEHNVNLPGLPVDFITRDFFRPSFSNTGVSTPAVNIIETNDDFRLEMVAPGMKKEAFTITLEENVLTIAYDHEDNRQGERRNLRYIMHEYNYHSFTRSFTLPETAEAQNIQAKYENGILTVIIPKRESTKGKMVRQITVS